ncbi:unnamed protein product [Brassica oleracea]
MRMKSMYRTTALLKLQQLLKPVLKIGLVTIQEIQRLKMIPNPEKIPVWPWFKRAYNYIHKYGYNSKLMSAAVRNKQDLFKLSSISGLIMLKVLLQSLKDPPTIPGDAKYSFVRKLSPDTATHYNFSNKEAKFKPPKLNRFANETLSASFIS